MKRPTGMHAFTTVWIGQVLSLLGTGMTRFALGIWAYELTGQATSLALIAVFSVAPKILFSPFAGVLVDRWNRKLVMMLSDMVAGISTLALLVLFLSGDLQVWHIYAAGMVAGIGESFQWPAYSATISTMLPKDQYARADGMLGLAGAASEILSPVAAGALLAWVGLGGIMLFDVLSFVFALALLLLVNIPQPTQSEAGREAQGSLWHETIYGFRYIRQRASLRGLLVVYLIINLIYTIAFTVMTPMVLARTGSDETLLGLVLSFGSAGGAVGGLLMSITGGTKRKIHGFVFSLVIAGICSLVMGITVIPLLWTMAMFLETLVSPIMVGSDQAIWQSKVPPDVQGRVFAARHFTGHMTSPIGLLAAGLLADRLFEPAMQPGGWLAPVFGQWVGTGVGSGMALMMVIFGVLGVLVMLSAYAFRPVREVETLLPDHDVAVA